MSASLGDVYQEHILEHFECPYHKGTLPGATCTHCERNPLCGDRVQLQLLLNEEGKVEKAYFDGQGCAISQAAASILCEEIEGKTVAEVEQMQAKDMLELLRVPLTASRQKCGLLGFKVLKTMLYSEGTPASPK